MAPTLRAASTLAVVYLLVLALVLPVPPLAALVAHAKWAPTLVCGLVAGWRSPCAWRPAALATGLFALLLAGGWTVFSSLSSGLEAAQAAVLFVASVPTSLVAALWAFAGMMLARRATVRVPPSGG